MHKNETTISALERTHLNEVMFAGYTFTHLKLVTGVIHITFHIPLEILVHAFIQTGINAKWFL